MRNFITQTGKQDYKNDEDGVKTDTLRSCTVKYLQKKIRTYKVKRKSSMVMVFFFLVYFIPYSLESRIEIGHLGGSVG